MTGEVHRVFRQTFLLCFAACALVACGPEVVRENRTEGLALEFRWISADLSRASYFEIACDGAFGSSGGVRARERILDYKTTLSNDDIARLVALLRATGFAERAKESGESGDRSELVVTEVRKRSAFKVLGPDATVDELLACCRDVSMRQFRDVIDSQPQSGERRR